MGHLDERDAQPVPLGAAARRWLTPLAVMALLGAVIGALITAGAARSYESQTVLLVGPVVPDRDLLEGTRDLARTYGQIVESRGLIKRAVDGTGVRSADVTVSASAGPSSALLTIRVRTPDRAATPVVARRVVESLRLLVAENRADVRIPAFGTLDAPAAEPVDGLDDGSPTFPIGSALTVVDDGNGRAARRSLSPVQGAVLGAVAAALATLAVVFTLAARRRRHPAADRVAELSGAYLGILPLPPTVVTALSAALGAARPAGVTGGGWVGVSSDSPARLEARLAADELLVRAAAGAGRCSLLAVVPRPDPAHLRAVIQLCDGFDQPPLLVDVHAVVAGWLLSGPAAGDVGGRRPVIVGGRTVASLVVPPPMGVGGPLAPPPGVDAARWIDGLRGRHATVVVLAVLDRSISAWWPWAAATAGSVAVLRPGDLDDERLLVQLDRQRMAPTPVIGGVLAARRSVRGRSHPVVVLPPVGEAAGAEVPVSDGSPVMEVA